MKRLLAWLARHPLVWAIPLALFLLLIVALAYKLGRTPDSPFLYDL